MNKKRKLILLTIVLCCFGAIIFSGCRKNNRIREGETILTFSRDTVIFDTVFTSIGSVTDYVKIYNTYPETIEIQKIYLASGNQSNYRINIDGNPSTHVEQVQLRPQDSLWIFVEVTVDPNLSTTPLIVTDSIIFETNAGLQDVDLVAWGQDAHFIYPNQYIPGFPALNVLECNALWTNDKPWVIYGYAFVDSLCSLTIEEGTQIHFHKNSGLWIYRNGVLSIEGTFDNPVNIGGDRLDAPYRDYPGQWDRIWINEGAGQVNIQNAVIKNGFIGIQAEAWPFVAGSQAANTIHIANTTIQNMAGMGIFVRNHNVLVENSLISNTGSHCIAISGGGKSIFKNVSFANYWNYGSRQDPLAYVTNIYEDYSGNIEERDLEEASFLNCIFYGNIENEFSYQKGSNRIYNLQLDYCLTKTKDPLTESYFSNLIQNPSMILIDGELKDPVFADPVKGDFQLYPESVAKDAGNNQHSQGLDVDNNNVPRIIGSTVDLGCFELE